MTTSAYKPWVHRLAVTTACVALLPITVGAVVTTMKWGMAFPDWPTSDGHNMFLYPWLRSAADKFTEHGHRLAGILIGCCSILIAAVVWRCDDRKWVRRLGVGVLLAVIVQGRLGGDRVLRDDPRWAMAHGAFAAIVFTLMCGLAMVTGRRWREDLPAAASPKSPSHDEPEIVSDTLRPFLMAAPFLVALQYLLGGFVRHLGMALYEHLGGAILVAIVGTLAAMAGIRSRVKVVSRLGLGLAAALGLQLLLGAGAWVTRFGFATLGYVAVNQSPMQVTFRTAHTVVGMLVLMTTILLALSVLAWERAGRGHRAASNESSELALSSALVGKGS